MKPKSYTEKNWTTKSTIFTLKFRTQVSEIHFVLYRTISFLKIVRIQNHEFFCPSEITLISLIEPKITK